MCSGTCQWHGGSGRTLWPGSRDLGPRKAEEGRVLVGTARQVALDRRPSGRLGAHSLCPPPITVTHLLGPGPPHTHSTRPSPQSGSHAPFPLLALPNTQCSLGCVYPLSPAGIEAPGGQAIGFCAWWFPSPKPAPCIQQALSEYLWFTPSPLPAPVPSPLRGKHGTQPRSASSPEPSPPAWPSSLFSPAPSFPSSSITPASTTHTAKVPLLAPRSLPDAPHPSHPHRSTTPIADPSGLRGTDPILPGPGSLWPGRLPPRGPPAFQAACVPLPARHPPGISSGLLAVKTVL